MTEDDGGAGTERLRYLSAAQHEVNTPLAVIRGWADTLVDMWDELGEGDRLHGAETIRRYSGELAGLLDAVFVEARLDAHARRAARGPVELAAVVTDAVAMARRATGGTLDERAPVEVATDRYAIVALVLAITEGLSHGENEVAVSVEAPGDRTVGLVFRASATVPPDDPFDAFPGGEPSPAGIRLSAARNLARAVGGDLEVVDGGDGSALRLLLPLV